MERPMPLLAPVTSALRGVPVTGSNLAGDRPSPRDSAPGDIGLMGADARASHHHRRSPERLGGPRSAPAALPVDDACPGRLLRVDDLRARLVEGRRPPRRRVPTRRRRAAREQPGSPGPYVAP